MKLPFLFIVLFITGCTSVKTTDYQVLYGPSAPKPRLLTEQQAQYYQQQHKVSFSKDVKPLLDSRCVVCHGCYDAPCQLKLGSLDGLDRGATKQLVYDSSRLNAVNPTRLFIDATHTADWRKKSFYPVLNERVDSSVANLDNSVLAKLLDLKRLHPQPVSGKLDQEYDLEFGRVLQCPTIDEFPRYQHEHPKWGMPYAMPGLSLQEENMLKQWLREGAKVDPLPPLSGPAVSAVAQWENYFNGTTRKQQLVFRYIYEHLFIGHLHFKGQADNEFFQLVRSKTAPGQTIEELKSVRPYDAPDGRFYYRLRPVTETIVDKTHFVYELSDQKRQRYDELFFKLDYQVTASPPYQPKVTANPFKVFVEIPLDSRYRFLLDDAGYFISGFIKGPVCRGQIALDSIRDQFWLVFFQPGKFYPPQTPEFLADNKQLLALPGQDGKKIGLLEFIKYDELGKQYLKNKNAYIDSVLPKDKGFGLSYIWDGEGINQNAALTVFRHLDSATVTKGFIGDTPLTGWVIDYPIFEQLHYLLVAGFNVYGSVGLQLASRTYMDLLRQDAEDNFLRFMPARRRQSIYDSWYIGPNSIRTAPALFNIDHETEVYYQTTEYKKEFFDQIRQKMGKAVGHVDTINRCQQEVCIRADTSPMQQQVDNEMRRLAKLKGHELDALPAQTLLRVNTGETQGDLVYTLLIDNAYSNISAMIAMNSRRTPEKDRITIVPGFMGSYPNLFLSADKNQLPELVTMLQQAQTETVIDQVYDKFAIRRSNPDLWLQADWFNAQHKKSRGLEAGLLDLSRYNNL